MTIQVGVADCIILFFLMMCLLFLFCKLFLDGFFRSFLRAGTTGPFGAESTRGNCCITRALLVGNLVTFRELGCSERYHFASGLSLFVVYAHEVKRRPLGFICFFFLSGGFKCTIGQLARRVSRPTRCGLENLGLRTENRLFVPSAILYKCQDLS